jgi:hypothetical protein
MSTCEGCFISAKGQARELETVRQAAKKYAVENGKTVAIYKEGQDYSFIEAGSAAGLYILEYVSQFNGTASA